MKKLKKLIKNQGSINTFNFFCFCSTIRNLKIFDTKRKFSFLPLLFTSRNTSIMLFNLYFVNLNIQPTIFSYYFNKKLLYIYKNRKLHFLLPTYFKKHPLKRLLLFLFLIFLFKK